MYINREKGILPGDLLTIIKENQLFIAKRQILSEIQKDSTETLADPDESKKPEAPNVKSPKKGTHKGQMLRLLDQVDDSTENLYSLTKKKLATEIGERERNEDPGTIFYIYEDPEMVANFYHPRYPQPKPKITEIDKSFAEYKIVITNIGNSAIDNPQMVVDISGKLVKITDRPNDNDIVRTDVTTRNGTKEIRSNRRLLL